MFSEQHSTRTAFLSLPVSGAEVLNLSDLSLGVKAHESISAWVNDRDCDNKPS